jgi:hypothetical protein
MEGTMAYRNFLNKIFKMKYLLFFYVSFAQAEITNYNISTNTIIFMEEV